MASGKEHAAVAALVVGVAAYADDLHRGKLTAAPLVAAGGATLLANIPDWLEPAIHSHHRKFCHSAVALGLVAYGAYRLYKWEPTDPLYKFLRYAGMVAGVCYVVHLLMDSQTPRGIPLI